MPLSFQNAGRGRPRNNNAALLGRGVKEDAPKPQQRRPIGQPPPLNRMPIGSHPDEPRHLTPRQHQDLLRFGGLAVAPKEFVFHGVANNGGVGGGGGNHHQPPPVTVGSRMTHLPQRSSPGSSPPRASHHGNNPIIKQQNLPFERRSHSDGIMSPARNGVGGAKPSPNTPPGLSSFHQSPQQPLPRVVEQRQSPQNHRLPPGQQYRPTGAVNHYREKQQARQNELLVRQHQLMYQQQREHAQQQYQHLLGNAQNPSSPLGGGGGPPPPYHNNNNNNNSPGGNNGWVGGNHNNNILTPRASPSKGPREEMYSMAQNVANNRQQQPFEQASATRNHHVSPPPKRDSESVYAIIAPETVNKSAAAPQQYIQQHQNQQQGRNPPPPLNPTHIQKKGPAASPRIGNNSGNQQHSSPIPQQQQHAAASSNPSTFLTNLGASDHPQQQRQSSDNNSGVLVGVSVVEEEEYHPLASLPFDIVYCSSEVIGRQLPGDDAPSSANSKHPSPTTAHPSQKEETGGHTVGELMKALELHWNELEAANSGGGGEGLVGGQQQHHPPKPVLSNGWLSHPSASADHSNNNSQEEEDSAYPIELIIRFPEGDADIRQLQVLTHEYKIPTKVEIRVFSLEKHLVGHKERLQQMFQKEEKRKRQKIAQGGDRNDEDEDGVPRRSPAPPGIDDDDRQLRSTALATLHHNALPSFKDVKFAKLGSVAFSNNEKSRFKAKERKTVHVNTRAYFVKLLFHAPHPNQYNNNESRHKILEQDHTGKGFREIEFSGSQIGVYSVLSIGDQTTTTTGNPANHADPALFVPTRPPARRVIHSHANHQAEPVDAALQGAGGKVVHRNLTSGGGGRSHHAAVGGAGNRPPDREQRGNEQLVDDELYKHSNRGSHPHQATGPTPEVPEVFDAPAYDPSSAQSGSRFPPIHQPQQSYVEGGAQHNRPLEAIPPLRRTTVAADSNSYQQRDYDRDDVAYPCLIPYRHDAPPSVAEIRSRPIAHFEAYYLRVHSQLIEQKSSAIECEDFDLAKLVKSKLVALQDKTKVLLEMESEKVKAMVEEDFERAIELRDRMNRTIKDVYTAMAATGGAGRQPSTRTSPSPNGHHHHTEDLREDNSSGNRHHLPQLNHHRGAAARHADRDDDEWASNAIPSERRHHQNSGDQYNHVVNQDDQPVMSKYAQKMADERRRGEEEDEDDETDEEEEDEEYDDEEDTSTERSSALDTTDRAAHERDEKPTNNGRRELSPRPDQQHERHSSKEDASPPPPFYDRWEDSIVAHIHRICDDAVQQQRDEATAAGGVSVDDEAFPFESHLTESVAHQTGSLGGGSGGNTVDVKRTEVGPLQHCFGMYTTACLVSRRWRLREAALKCIRTNLLTLYSAPSNPGINTAIGAANEAVQKSNNPNLNSGIVATPYIQSSVLTLLMYLDVKGLGITDPVASVAIAACGIVEAIGSQEFNGNNNTGGEDDSGGNGGGKPIAPYYAGALQNLLPRLMFRAADASPSAGKVREECARIIVNILPDVHALGVDRVVIGGILPHPTDADKKRLAEPLGTKVQLSRVTMFSLIMDKYRGTRSGKYFAQIIQSSSGASESETATANPPVPTAITAPRVLSLEILLRKLLISSLNHPAAEVREAAVAAFSKIPVDFSSPKVSGSEYFQRFLQMIKNPTIRAVIEERLVSSIPPAVDVVVGAGAAAVDRRGLSPSPPPQPPTHKNDDSETTSPTNPREDDGDDDDVVQDGDQEEEM